jgi:hypothetical protein
VLSFGLEGKPPAADIEGEGAVVFPSKRTITLAFEEDVATLKLYGRMQDALILFNSVFLAMFWSVSQVARKLGADSEFCLQRTFRFSDAIKRRKWWR